MKRIIPNIVVDNCKEALEYYKEIFHGDIRNVQMADGKEMFKGFEGKVVHAELHITADCIIYLNDNFGEKAGDSSISLLLELESEEEISNLYSALKKDGSVEFELQKTFWGSYHGVVTDRFGITWSMDYAVR